MEKFMGGAKKETMDLKIDNGLAVNAESMAAGQDEAPPSSEEMRRETVLINSVTLLLAEKRTSLSVMRTGLAILALPTSVVSVLIVISKYYEPGDVIYLLGPLLALCVFLSILGCYMIAKSMKRINHLSHMVTKLKQRNAHLKGLSMIMEGLIGPDNDF